MNFLPQTGQSKFFSPVCVRVCLANSSLRANRLPQELQRQGKGRSPARKERMRAFLRAISVDFSILWMRVNNFRLLFREVSSVRRSPSRRPPRRHEESYASERASTRAGRQARPQRETCSGQGWRQKPRGWTQLYKQTFNIQSRFGLIRSFIGKLSQDPLSGKFAPFSRPFSFCFRPFHLINFPLQARHILYSRSR